MSGGGGRGGHPHPVSYLSLSRLPTTRQGPVLYPVQQLLKGVCRAEVVIVKMAKSDKRVFNLDPSDMISQLGYQMQVQPPVQTVV